MMKRKKTTPKKVKGAVRGRLSDGAPNPIDVHVGGRVKMRRCLLGMTQERLAEELGLTFQQVQKYEHGMNRIGASRLWDLSQVLGVGVEFFYQGIDDSVSGQSPRKIYVTSPGLSSPMCEFDMDTLLRRDVTTLLRTYTKISDPKVQRNILEITYTLALNSLTDEEKEELAKYQKFVRGELEDGEN